MANVIYNQKIQSSTKSFAGQFGHRENALVTANFTLLSCDSDVTIKPLDGISHVVADPTAASFTITLPAPAQCKGRAIRLRRTAAGVNTLSVVSSGGANVGPTATFAIAAIGNAAFFSTGSAWVQIS